MTDLAVVKWLYLEPKEQESYDMMTTEVALIVRSATSVAVTSQEDANNLAELLLRGGRACSQLEEHRKAIVDPLNKQLKDINGIYKKLTEQLEDLDMQGKARIAAWKKEDRARIDRERQEQQRKMEEAARAEREAMERAAKARSEAARKKALEEAQAASRKQSEAELAMPREAPKHIRTESGMLLEKKIWKAEVVDAAMVPRSFCSPDIAAIRAAVKAGTREIPGVHIYEGEDLSVNPGR